MTFRDYYNFFPEPIKSQLFKNTEPFFLDIETQDPEFLLSDAFTWADTEEGFEYWADLEIRIHEFINF